MKKIICISLIMILTLALLAGCAGKNANPTPLTPVYANGVSPNYSSSGNNTDDTDDSQGDETPDDAQDSTIPEGYARYSDMYVSFIHPDTFSKTLSMRLHDAENDSDISIYAEAVDKSGANFELNVYTDVSPENFAESYVAVIGNTENTADVTVTKSTKNGYEITVVKYFEATEEEEEIAETTPEENPEETTEETEPEEEVAEPRLGTAHIYIEKSSDEAFKEIMIEVAANQYPANAIPEDYINFADIVSKIVSSLIIITE